MMVESSFHRLSIAWSLRTCIMLHWKTLKTHKMFFGTKPSLISMLWGMIASLRRILGIIGYFAPSLGLFSIHYHWIAEQYPFTMRNSYHPLPFDRIHLFNTTEKMLWKEYDRATYEFPKDPAPPSFRAYTGFDLKYSFILFFVLLFFQSVSMALVKYFCSEEFKADNRIYNKVVHVLQCTNISFPYVDWDQGGGSVEEFKLRYSNTEREMAWSFVVNSFFSLASIVPIIYTGRCMPKTSLMA